jgi:hypothetical protein
MIKYFVNLQHTCSFTEYLSHFGMSNVRKTESATALQRRFSRNGLGSNLNNHGRAPETDLFVVEHSAALHRGAGYQFQMQMFG